jgi:hypothetical protein
LEHILRIVAEIAILELCRLWCARERDDVTDVLHASNKQNEALEAEAKACMWA